MQHNATPTQTQAQTPMSEAPKLRPRSGRTPLKPMNSPIQNPSQKPKTKPDARPDKPLIEISLDKENRPIPSPPPPPPLPDSSLAEELEAIKKKLERLRLDKEKTEKTLKEKDAILDAKMNELQQRGEIQKNLEIQVDRLFRLKELKSRCMRVSPMRTLREKEQRKIVNESPSPSEVKTEEMVEYESESECREEREMQSPGSACSQTHTHINITVSGD